MILPSLNEYPRMITSVNDTDFLSGLTVNQKSLIHLNKNQLYRVMCVVYGDE